MTNPPTTEQQLLDLAQQLSDETGKPLDACLKALRKAAHEPLKPIGSLSKHGPRDDD